MTIVEILRALEAKGIRVYLRGDEIRVRGQVPPESMPLIHEIAGRLEETWAVLELWGEPCTPEEEERVQKAFSRPETFIIYDERTGEMRWIC